MKGFFMTLGKVTVAAGTLASDFSFARPDVAALQLAGFKTVVRYLSVPPANPLKNATSTELQTYLAAGLNVLLVFEVSAGTALGGRPLGLKHGLAAFDAARVLGYPTDVPVLCAVDTNVTDVNVDVIEAYVRAFAENCSPYPIGVYGDADILLRVGPLSVLGWLPNAAAWSDPQKVLLAKQNGLVHVQQRRGFYLNNLWAQDPNDVLEEISAWGTIPYAAPIPTTLPPAGGKLEGRLVAAATHK